MVSRSYYVDDYCDETIPCAPTLSGWASFLASDGSAVFGDPLPDFPHPDGATFATQAIRWLDDIVATKVDGKWTLSRQPEPEADFFAVRFGEGAGWSVDQILNPDGAEDSLLAAFNRLYDECADDYEFDEKEFIAVGVHEPNWMLTLHHGTPPYCTAGPRQ